MAALELLSLDFLKMRKKLFCFKPLLFCFFLLCAPKINPYWDTNCNLTTGFQLFIYHDIYCELYKIYVIMDKLYIASLCLDFPICKIVALN